MLCLAALARGMAGNQSNLHAAAKTLTIPQPKLTQMIKQLAPNLQVTVVVHRTFSMSMSGKPLVSNYVAERTRTTLLLLGAW